MIYEDHYSQTRQNLRNGTGGLYEVYAAVRGPVRCPYGLGWCRGRSGGGRGALGAALRSSRARECPRRGASNRSKCHYSDHLEPEKQPVCTFPLTNLLTRETAFSVTFAATFELEGRTALSLLCSVSSPSPVSSPLFLCSPSCPRGAVGVGNSARRL